jgi:hypothetical protein
VFNAEEIRQLVLGRHSSLTALSISRNGEHFITATQDSLVKVSSIFCKVTLFFIEKHFKRHTMKCSNARILEQFELHFSKKWKTLYR